MTSGHGRGALSAGRQRLRVHHADTRLRGQRWSDLEGSGVCPHLSPRCWERQARGLS